MRKRVNALKPKKDRMKSAVGKSSESSTHQESISAVLSHVTQGCYTKDVHYSCCVPLCLLRPTSKLAIKKLKVIFDGKASENQVVSGVFSITPSSTVVPLVGELEYLISDYFQKQGYSEQDSEHLKSKHSEWFGIVDGCQFHSAISELAEESPSKWGDFQWKVTVLRPGKSLLECRQLARIENEIGKESYRTQTTIYDLLHGLRVEYDELYQMALKASRVGSRGVKVHHKDVAHRFDGADHSDLTYVRQAVSVASRISHKTIEAIGQVCNQDCVNTILHNKSLNGSALKTEEELYAQKDCRLFRSFVCFGSLRGAKAFMNAVQDGNEDAQSNTIYRMKHWSELHGYKPVQTTIVTEQFGLSILALKEQDKFLNHIGETEWPPHMESIKENILHTTGLDSELQSNAGNDTDVLPSIWRCYTRLYPANAKNIEEKNNSDDTSTKTDPPKPDSTDPPIINSGKDSDSNSSDKNDGKEASLLEAKRQEMLQLWSRKRGEANSHLQKCNISSYQMNMSAFLTEVWSSTTPKADLVISSIPENLPDTVLEEIPSFSKRVLHSGSYVFLIVSERQFPLLESSFKKLDFKVMEKSFKILYDPSSMKRSNVSDFPQKHSDIAILAKTKGTHPENFEPFFGNNHGSELSGGNVQFASVVNIKSCQNKLKRPREISSLRTSEKSVELFSYIVRMLTPTGGSVIDPIAGPMTASISCLDTGRSCLSLEEDKDCYRFAIGRTRIYATTKATMENLEMYSEPIDVDSIESELANDEASPSRKRQRLSADSEKGSMSVDTDEEPASSSEIDTDVSSARKAQYNEETEKHNMATCQTVETVDSIIEEQGVEALLMIGNGKDQS